MKIVIDIPEAKVKDAASIDLFYIVGAVMNGTPLSEYMKELKRRLLMEVDGGTDDRYLRYADVCNRISNTIDTYIKAESEE